jgi:hypothetical protein
VPDPADPNAAIGTPADARADIGSDMVRRRQTAFTSDRPYSWTDTG